MVIARGGDEAIQCKEDDEDGNEDQVQVKKNCKEPPEEFPSRGCLSWNDARLLCLHPQQINWIYQSTRKSTGEVQR